MVQFKVTFLCLNCDDLKNIDIVAIQTELIENDSYRSNFFFLHLGRHYASQRLVQHLCMLLQLNRIESIQLAKKANEHASFAQGIYQHHLSRW